MAWPEAQICLYFVGAGLCPKTRLIESVLSLMPCPMVSALPSVSQWTIVGGGRIFGNLAEKTDLCQRLMLLMHINTCCRRQISPPFILPPSYSTICIPLIPPKRKINGRASNVQSVGTSTWQGRSKRTVPSIVPTGCQLTIFYPLFLPLGYIQARSHFFPLLKNNSHKNKRND